MLDVALAIVPTWDNDGQAMFSAQSITGLAYLMVTAFVGIVVLVVDEADRIENQIVMNMSLINMSSKHKLVLATPYFFASWIPILWTS